MSFAPVDPSPPSPPGPAATVDEGVPLPRRSQRLWLQPGTCLGGRYTIDAELGKGGMGTVFAAHDRVADHPVALKFIHPELANDASARRRLRAELKAALAVSHANVARTHTLEELDGHTFLVMERLDGPTLADRLRQGPVPAAEALRLARGILAGVAAAHEHGVAHRDLKPLNIKICAGGRAVVMDFGLAVLHERRDGAPGGTNTHWGGTPGYMAPEVAKGAIGDARADVYALGVVLFELFVGKSPLAIGETLSQDESSASQPLLTWRRHRGAVPGWLATLLRELLRDDPARRPADAGQVLRRMERLRGRRSSALKGGVALAVGLAAVLALVSAATRQPSAAPEAAAPSVPSGAPVVEAARDAADAGAEMPALTPPVEPVAPDATPAPVERPTRRVRGTRPSAPPAQAAPAPEPTVAPEPAAPPAAPAAAPAPAEAEEDSSAAKRRRRLHLDD